MIRDMVGKRARTLGKFNTPAEEQWRDVEEAAGGHRTRHAFHFKDAVELVIADKHRAEVKKRLMEGIQGDAFEDRRTSPEELKQMKSKQLRRYYQTQNARLDDFLEVDSLVKAMASDIIDSMRPDPDRDGIAEREAPLQTVGESIEQFLPEDERERRRVAAKKARWAININLIVNVLLLAAKVIALIINPSSLSLIASTVDSALDLLCNLIIWGTTKIAQWRLASLKRRFPVGRRRIEPLGILVFSTIMVLSFVQILQESIGKLLPGGDREPADLSPVAIGALLSNLIVKGVIWIGCIPIKTTQVQALAQDCKTDVLFNALSLLFPFVGLKAHIWWLDPAGAAILSLYVIYDWGETCFENVTRLSGTAVDDRLLHKLTFLAYRFSPVVEGFKNLTAYHAGDGVWVEFDLLLDEKMPLHEAHDIAETLQYCSEGLGEVDRAFVTTDYTVVGPTGHSADI